MGKSEIEPELLGEAKHEIQHQYLDAAKPVRSSRGSRSSLWMTACRERSSGIRHFSMIRRRGAISVTKEQSMIDGVVIKPLRRIVDERGKIMHMLRNDDPGFESFGEI